MAAYISANGLDVVPVDFSMADKEDVVCLMIGGTGFLVKTISGGACADIRGGAEVLRGRVSLVCEGEWDFG